MVDVTMLVDDTLLRELALETRRIGTRVWVRPALNQPGFVAEIADIIIMPGSDFYRIKFMQCYAGCGQNSVKALKELGSNFPYSPDYALGIGYVLNVGCDQGTIKIRSEIEIGPYPRTED